MELQCNLSQDFFNKQLCPDKVYPPRWCWPSERRLAPLFSQSTCAQSISSCPICLSASFQFQLPFSFIVSCTTFFWFLVSVTWPIPFLMWAICTGLFCWESSRVVSPHFTCSYFQNIWYIKEVQRNHFSRTGITTSQS